MAHNATMTPRIRRWWPWLCAAALALVIAILNG